jgi:glutamate:GABA antiporter
LTPETPRPFKVSGSDGILKSIYGLTNDYYYHIINFTAIPLQYDKASLTEQLPITIGAIIFIVIGELIIKFKKIKK